MIPGDPTLHATKALALDKAVAGFRQWLERHQDDPHATFTMEVRDGRFLGVETSTVAWYSRSTDDPSIVS